MSEFPGEMIECSAGGVAFNRAALARRDERITSLRTSLKIRDEHVDSLKARIVTLEARIAEQRQTIDHLTDAVALWMDRAGESAP